MATNCVSGLNSTGILQLSSAATAIRLVSASVDENGRLILVSSDGSTVTSTTSDCCCCTLASKNYALSTLQQNAAAFGAITITTSNGELSDVTLQTTPIVSTNPTVEVTTGTTTNTVAVRDIESITFTTAPTNTTVLDSLNCDSSDAPQCSTNIALETALRDVISASADPVEFPVTISGTLDITTGLLSASCVKTIYGICNGILWAAVTKGESGEGGGNGNSGGDESGGGKAKLQAIPLCTVEYISYTPE